jgi:peptidoglycan/LPS O-acetylase OafA/YrhL
MGRNTLNGMKAMSNSNEEPDQRPMANSGGDEENRNELSPDNEHFAPREAETESSAGSKFGQTLESKFAARRRKKLEEIAATAATKAEDLNTESEFEAARKALDPQPGFAATTGFSQTSSGSEPTDQQTEIAKRFLTKLNKKLGREAPAGETSAPEARQEPRQTGGKPDMNHPTGGQFGRELDYGASARARSMGEPATPEQTESAINQAQAQESQADSFAHRQFKPRKDLSSYKSGLSTSSAARLPEPDTNPGEISEAPINRGDTGSGSAAYEYGAGKPTELGKVPKSALDAIPTPKVTSNRLEPVQNKAETEPVTKARRSALDSIPTPKAPTADQIARSSQLQQTQKSDVGWNAVPDEDTPKAVTKKPVASPQQRSKEKESPPPFERPKPYKGREEEPQIPKNRWGQLPDGPAGRSVWADQLGINKPQSASRSLSANVGRRLKRVMSSDIFNVRELYSLRGVAALFVFAAQAQVFAAHEKPVYPLSIVGAQIFFVMSGFVITRWLLVNETGWIRRDLMEFYARRVLRIFPMYYLALAVLYFMGHLPYAESFFCGLFNLKLYDLGAAKSLGALAQYWPLSVELQFYALFPVVLLLTPQRFRMALVLLLTGTTVTLTYLSLQQTPNAQDFMLLPICGQFIMFGALAAYFDVKSDMALSFNASLCTIIGLTAVIGLNAFEFYHPPADITRALWKDHSVLFAISLAILMFGLWRTNNEWLKALCANDVLAYMGKISYGFYLLLPVVFFLLPSLDTVVPLLTKVHPLISCFVLTFLAAVVSWHYLQVPINNMREQLPIAK